MGKKEKQRKEVRRTRIAQREHRGLYGQQARRGLSRREQEEMSEHLQEAISSPERLEENLELLEGLFESEEELRALRFEPRETLTLAIKHGILEKSVMEDEDLRTERMDRVLSNLVTPDFARQVSQTVQKVAQRRRHENAAEAAALYLARLLLEARGADLKRGENPVWAMLLRMSLTEAMGRAEELGVELPEEVEEVTGRIEDLEDYLDSDILHEELERLLEEHPEILEGYQDFSLDTAQNLIELAWTGGLGFLFELPEVLHALLPLSELAREFQQQASRGVEADLQPEERALEVLQECFAADLSESLTRRFESWLDGQMQAPEAAGRERLLATARRMTEMFDPEDNPLYLALYYASLIAACEMPPEGYEEEVQALLEAPSSPEAYLDYGEALLENAQPEYAIRAFGRALELDPDDFAGHEGLARCYQALNRFDEARREMEQALEKARLQASQNPESGLETAIAEMQTFLKELSGEARADEDWEVPAEATEGSVTPYEQD
jgi:tetratricopeptide (TPR) repeat protein